MNISRTPTEKITRYIERHYYIWDGIPGEYTIEERVDGVKVKYRLVYGEGTITTVALYHADQWNDATVQHGREIYKKLEAAKNR